MRGVRVQGVVCAVGRAAALSAAMSVLAAAAVALGGCGSGGSDPGGPSAARGGGAAGAAPNVVEVKVTEKGYEPSRIVATVGKPVTLRVTRVTDKTCATEIVFKDPPLRHELPLNTPVEVTLTPTKAGEIPFSCAMNMVGGVIDAH